MIRDFLFCHELMSFCRELTSFSREFQFCFAVAVNFILPWLSCSIALTLEGYPKLFQAWWD
jgi:hypothetical protein